MIGPDSLFQRVVRPNKMRIGRYSFIALTILLALLLTVVTIYDPSDLHYTICPVNNMTGFFCTTCGATRSAHALLNCRFADAVSYNPFFVFYILPVFALLWVYFLCRFFFNITLIPGCGRWIVLFSLVLALLFMAVRNIPGPGLECLRPHPASYFLDPDSSAHASR